MDWMIVSHEDLGNIFSLKDHLVVTPVEVPLAVENNPFYATITEHSAHNMLDYALDNDLNGLDVFNDGSRYVVSIAP